MGEDQEYRVGLQLWTRWITGPLSCVDFSPRKHFAAMGFDDGSVQFIDSHGSELWTVQLEVPITHIRIIEKKNQVVVLDEHSRMTFLDFEGRVVRKKNFRVYWTSFEVKKNGLVTWGWKAPPRELDLAGKEKVELKVPGPWREVRAVADSDMYFVVHNQIALGVYRGNGEQLWLTNHPTPMDLSRENPSDIVVSDNGNRAAVACFEKGVYVYNLKEATLQHIDLEKRVDHVAVSGDGRYLLIADSLCGAVLVSTDATVVWDKQMDARAWAVALDRKGNRALVVLENGSMVCYEFSDRKRERKEFLEVASYERVGENRECWVKPAPPFQGNWSGLLKISGDGRYILFGHQKNFVVLDPDGNTVWRKSFMVRRSDGWVSHDGGLVLLTNEEEIFAVNPLGGTENHLTFYGEGIAEVGWDPSGERFLVFHKNGGFTLYSAGGRCLWKRSLKQRVSKIRLNDEHHMAVFQGVGRTLYTLDLKTLKAGRIVLEEPIARLRINPSSIYVGSENGTCYGLDYHGSVRWTHSMDGRINKIVPLNQAVVFIGEEGRALVFQDDGVVLGEGRLRNAHSVLHYSTREILEVASEGTSLGCYRFLSGERLWQLPLEQGVQGLAVSQWGNRMVALSGADLHCLRLSDDPDPVSDRTAFLEF